MVTVRLVNCDVVVFHHLQFKCHCFSTMIFLKTYSVCQDFELTLNMRRKEVRLAMLFSGDRGICFQLYGRKTRSGAALILETVSGMLSSISMSKKIVKLFHFPSAQHTPLNCICLLHICISSYICLPRCKLIN